MRAARRHPATSDNIRLSAASPGPSPAPPLAARLPGPGAAQGRRSRRSAALGRGRAGGWRRWAAGGGPGCREGARHGRTGGGGEGLGGWGLHWVWWRLLRASWVPGPRPACAQCGAEQQQARCSGAEPGKNCPWLGACFAWGSECCWALRACEQWSCFGTVMLMQPFTGHARKICWSGPVVAF